MQIILKEFEYQSSLELESDTYDAISHIPLANKIGVHARQVRIAIWPWAVKQAALKMQAPGYPF